MSSTFDPLAGLLDQLADAIDASGPKVALRQRPDSLLEVETAGGDYPLVSRGRTKQILIDSGPSRRGWSRIGRALHCLQLYAYSSVLGLDLGSKQALLRGTLGHIGLAHQLRRWQEQQQGRDPDAFYEPEEAMEVWCDLHPEGRPHLGRMLDTFRHYCATWPEPPGEIVLVEQEIALVLGWRRELTGPRWGFWVITHESAAEVERIEHEKETYWVRRAEAVAEERDPDEIPVPVPPKVLDTPSGLQVDVTLLDAPGHKNHGWPIALTRRIDAVWKERSGRLIVVDHKATAADLGSGRAQKYAMDGQFSALRLIGAQMWPSDFSHLLLNLVGTESPWKATRQIVPATPWRDGQFAWQIYEIEHRIAQLEMRKVDPWHWPKAQSELACWGRYGPCHGFDLCSVGPSAATRDEDR